MKKTIGKAMTRLPQTVLCETCGKPTEMGATKRCDACWEVERRLAPYLASSPVAVVFVESELARMTLPPGDSGFARVMVEMWSRLAKIREEAERKHGGR